MSWWCEDIKSAFTYTSVAAMKPVISETALEIIFNNNPVMFLNKRLFSVHYIKQLRALKTTPLTASKNALPTEIWDMIYDLVLANEEDSYCWVRAVSWTDTLLHCREIIFQYPQKCGNFRNKAEMEDFDDTVKYISNQRRKSELTYRETSRFAIRLPLPDRDALLYEVSTQDVIKCMEGGNCNLCWNMRRINTDKRAKKMFGIVAYTGVKEFVVCPLCIGVEEAVEHCRLFERYRAGPWNQDVVDRRSAWVNETVNMRGYENEYGSRDQHD